MIPKVSSLWRMGAMTLIGMVLGIGVALKWIAPPSQDIKVGKITIKGRNNTVTDAVDISKQDEQDNSTRKERREKRKADKE